MSITRNGPTTSGRLLRRLLTAVTLMLLCVGCSSTPGPVETLLRPLEGSSKEQALHKQVDADSFPSAKQAGL